MSTNARFLAKLFRLTDADYLDSAEVVDLIDSNYITARVGEVGGGTVDSADILSIVDSAYITDKLQGVYIADRTIDTFRYISTEGQSVFQNSDDDGNVLSYTTGDNLQVFLNGVLLDKVTDYVATNGSSITINDSLSSGDEITVQDFETKFVLDVSNIVDSAYVSTKIPKHSGSISLNTFKFSSTANQTVYSGSDLSGNTLAFDSDNIIVFVNGVNIIQNEDFTTQNGSSLTLSEPADSLDEVFLINFSKYFSTALDQIDSAYVVARIPKYASTTEISQYRYIATANQSVFSGSDNAGNILSYDSQNLQVFLNGVFLVKGDDYIANTGTSLSLTSPADSGFDLVINSFSKYSITESITTVIDSGDPWTEISVTHNAAASEKLIVDTSSTSTTINLPASPQFGDQISVVDGTGNASSNNIVINRNGNNILGVASDITINANNGSITLVYYNASRGWIITAS